VRFMGFCFEETKIMFFSTASRMIAAERLSDCENCQYEFNEPLFTFVSLNP
jgi:hypothetical protein